MTKRTDYISWDQYFMGVALLSAQRLIPVITFISPFSRLLINIFPDKCLFLSLS